MRLFLAAFLLLCSTALGAVKTARVPEGGIQPQAAADAKGVIHLVYYKGPDNAGDLFYVTSTDGGETFGKPVRVNSHPGSALAVGAIRGAQMALGRDGRVHVAWNGSGKAQPKAPNDTAPMLYTRSDGKGGFEPERNLITKQIGLDGGGAVAADDAGNVYVAWQAPQNVEGKEADRRVWIAISSDDGQTFAPERKFSIDNTGVCACCGMKMICTPLGPVLMYRAAVSATQRDMHVIVSDKQLTRMESTQSRMTSGTCPMSSCAILWNGSRHVFAFEENKTVIAEWSIGEVNKPGYKHTKLTAGPGKYPSLARNAAGDVLIARAVGTSWNKGGSIAWQAVTERGEAIDKGDAKDLPAWSFPAAIALPGGDFLIVY